MLTDLGVEVSHHGQGIVCMLEREQLPSKFLGFTKHHHIVTKSSGLVWIAQLNKQLPN